MKHAIKGALLSGLVLPGLGQVVLKQYVRGFAFMVVALGCTVWIVNSAVEAAMTSLQNLEGLAPPPPPVAGDAGPAVWILGLCWLAALVDAYRLGARLDRQGPA